MAEVKNSIVYCSVCKRILGVGCACGMSFKDKMKHISLTLPANFRAV